MKYIRMNKYNCFIINNLINVINLKYAMIETFPILPDNIFEIYLDNNNITEISCRLPSNLCILSVCSNLIKELFFIPLTLKELYVTNNKNILLPKKITTELTVFYCNDCNLTTLPKLPTTLITLNASNNKLTKIDVPINLQILNIVNNQITKLYLTELHRYLNEIRCDNNKITNINYLPNSVSELHCNYNMLKTFPDIPINLNNPYGLKIVPNSVKYPYNLKILFTYWNNPIVYDLKNISNIREYINTVNRFRIIYYTYKLINALFKHIQKRRKYLEEEYEFL